ncbi:MAG: HD domain-containing protein [Anaerolineales bacterium]
MAPNLELAKQYALDRLARELSPALHYHSLAHTRDEVVGAAARLAEEEGVTGEPLSLLLTAAYFHDIGFIYLRDGHELAGARIAAEALPRFDYSPADIEAVTRMIMATQLPQSPANVLEAILADADLDMLGRDIYWQRHRDLRAEWAAFGQIESDYGWYRIQLAFQSGHQYFTAAARRLRGPTKQGIIERLRTLNAELAPAA